jgi:hypothetical protein
LGGWFMFVAFLYHCYGGTLHHSINSTVHEGVCIFLLILGGGEGEGQQNLQSEEKQIDKFSICCWVDAAPTLLYKKKPAFLFKTN